MKFSRNYLHDTIYACWLGKNIGGTIGTPYEGKTEIQDIHGFASEAGNPLPNDDLDLQLAWLRCVDELGPENVNSKTLGEYWLTYVKPHWNEYGVGKANMRAGIMPPMSGELFNDHWKNSNGAWIRTEIWACLYPGQVEKAIACAFEDASVDHGFAEGSYAAIFVAAMESAAFVIKDFRTLVKIGLSKIPADCRVAKAVKLTLECFDNGEDWKETRRKLVEQSADIGWFQAPSNVAYCILGMLYGGCDFKKSIILAVDCGDDTDCTGATVGAFLGILHGLDGIPGDWRKHIGDGIVNKCLLDGHGHFPKSCSELTDCVMNLLPVTLRTSMQTLYLGLDVEICDENDFSEVNTEKYLGTMFVDSLMRRSRYSFSVEGIFADAVISFDDKPVIAPLQSIKGKIMMIPHKLPGAKLYSLKWYLPEGWSVLGGRTLFTPASYRNMVDSEYRDAETEFTIVAGEHVDAINSIVLDISMTDHPTHILAPITILA